MFKLNVQTLQMTTSLRLKTVNMYNEYLSLNIELHLRDVVYGHSFPRTFVPTRFLTGPDIRAHIK